MVCAVLDIFDFIMDNSTAGRAHQLPKSLIFESEQQLKLLCTFLRKRGYQGGKASCFIWGPQTAKPCILPAAPYAQRGQYLAKHKGTHERFSPGSSRISLSGTTVDFTQIIQSFNNLRQTTSADPLPQETPSGVLMCPEKGHPLPLLFISFCHLSSLYSTQERKQCYSSSSPAQPHQPLQAAALNTQLLLQAQCIIIPCLTCS